MKKKWKIPAAVLSLILCVCPAGGVYAAGPAEVQETPAQEAAGVTELPAEVMSYSGYEESWQIPNTAQQGIYFLNNDTLMFYRPSDGSFETAYRFACDWVISSYAAQNKLYVLARVYLTGSGYVNQLEIYDLDQKAPEQKIVLSMPELTAVGADDAGQIYLAGMEDETAMVYLLASDGTLLSSATAPSEIYRFSGFDAQNGNFYFECYYNWLYWGSHDMNALGMGVCKDHTLTVGKMIAQTISQRYYAERQRAAALLGGRYLCVDAPLSVSGNLLNPAGAGVFLYDSHAVDTGWNAGFLTALDRNYEKYVTYGLSTGPRCVCLEREESLISCTEDQILTEYDLETFTAQGSYRTAHPVFSLETDGDVLYAVEKEEEQFYLETIVWQHSKNLEIRDVPDALYTGQSYPLTLSADGTLQETFTWQSSDPKVLSVGRDGTLFAWHEGSAVITVTASNGVSSSVMLTVQKNPAFHMPARTQLDLQGKALQNLSQNNYTVWSSVVGSYLAENDDQTLTRVQAGAEDGSILAETYDRAGALLSSKSIARELPYFGGFFSGAANHYMVFGAANPSEDDKAEVLRIVKYDKNFNRLQSVSVFGANTYEPFDAGSLRMTEADGKLCVYTCHTMYDEGDGLHHQANMTFVIDENSMMVADSYYDVMNISYGYVSHSFNQLIRTDGTYLYRVDHGDAYPRGISLTRCRLNDSITNVAYTVPFEIAGNAGDNYTGVSVGGFELGSHTCLIAGNSEPQQEDAGGYGGYNEQRNIFVSVTDQSSLESKTIWLTNYLQGSGITVCTPQLVKIGDDQFLLMWEEYTASVDHITTKMVTLDGEGTCTSDIVSTNLRLSDCQPVMDREGRVRWFVSDGARTTMYAVHPFALSELSVFMYGDLDGDVNVSASDALLVLKAAAKLIVLDDQQTRAADVDNDRNVSAGDALQILKKAAQLIPRFPVEEGA